MAVFSSVSSLEKSVVRTALYSDLSQLKYVHSTTLFYTLVNLLRHKARCRCPACDPKVEEIMELTKSIPSKTSPARYDDKEWRETCDPFVGLWNICKDVFCILETCHAIPRDGQGFISSKDIRKLDTFFTATKVDDGKTEYSTAHNSWEDTDDDENDEEQSQV